MADQELVRVEIGLRGREGLTARIPLKDAEDLEQRLRAGEDTVVDLQAEDARYLVVLAHVLYVKRYARESRVGFSSR
jgi:hypothetical protein